MIGILKSYNYSLGNFAHCTVLAVSILFIALYFPDLGFFTTSLSKYTKQHEIARAIQEERSVGLLLVDAKKLKEVLIPSPLRLLEVTLLLILLQSSSFYYCLLILHFHSRSSLMSLEKLINSPVDVEFCSNFCCFTYIFLYDHRLSLNG